MSRAWAEIDLRALRHNLRQVHLRVGPQVGVLCAVKADAYGHGAVPVARCLEAAGAQMLGVSCAEEGMQLRQAGLRLDILILEALESWEIPSVFEHRIIPSVSPPEIFEALEAEAARRRVRWPVHLMVDTGMSRGGVPPAEALHLACWIARSRHLGLVGVGTHFACADEQQQDYVTHGQMEAFEEFLANLKNVVSTGPILVHAANSSATFLVPGSFYRMVRPGICLYGMAACAKLHEQVALRPVLSLKTRVLYVRRVEAGTPVGYGHTYRTARPSVLATLGIGYADGLVRAASNRACVLLRGQRVPVVGRVSMDYTAVDVTDVPGVSLGDEVVVVGQQAGERITAEEFAQWTNRIPHEVTCALGRRVRRMYLNEQPSPDEPAPRNPASHVSGFCFGSRWR